MRVRAETSASAVRRSRRHLAAGRWDSRGARDGRFAGDEAKRAR